MKIGIIGDIHFSEYSSILRSRGTNFSVRLENCIESINWAEQVTKDCDEVIYLGDFFDKSTLNAEELTALSKIKWNNIHHKFLVGNHEMGINNLMYSSAHIFNGLNMEVIDKPMQINNKKEDLSLCFLPYILENDRKSLSEYFPTEKQKHTIIFSHNDLAGIQLGPIISKAGFNLSEISNECDLFFNGHIHNGMPITNKIINVGNLTGQNFSEDGFKYSHNIFILDTDIMGYTVIKNPYAINFYKIENINDLSKVENAVVTVKVKSDIAPKIKKKLDKDSKIIASRLIIDYSKKADEKDIKELLSIDHLDEFKKFIITQLSGSVNMDLVREELDYIYG